MADLIDRQAAIDEANAWLLECLGVQKQNRSCGLIRRLEDLPSAQPEIIRCKDCKYADIADKDDSQDGYTCQFHRGSIWFSGSYCSWAEKAESSRAERRTDE